MIPNVYSCGNGVLLRTCREEKFKSSFFSVSYALPLKKEEAALLTLLFSVLRRGTEKYPTLFDVNRRLDSLYGTDVMIRNLYRGDLQVVGFCADVLEDAYISDASWNFKDVLEVIGELLYHPLLDENGLLCETYVESEKKQQIDQIRGLKNNPSSYATAKARELLYHSDPCGTSALGTEEQIAKVTPRELTELWKRTVCSVIPECFYVGNAVSEKIASAIREILCKNVGNQPGREGVICPTAPVETVFVQNDSMPVSQSHLLLGFTGGDTLESEEYYASKVFNELLGASPIARLFMTVREKMGLCYSCYSSYNGYKGTMLVGCGILSQNRKQAEEEILAQIASIQKGDFSKEELEAAKKSLINNCRQIEDAPDTVEGFYSSGIQYHLNDTPDSRRESYQSVTAADVQKAAGKMKCKVVYFLEGTLANEEDFDDVSI